MTAIPRFLVALLLPAVSHGYFINVVQVFETPELPFDGTSNVTLNIDGGIGTIVSGVSISVPYDDTLWSVSSPTPIASAFGDPSTEVVWSADVSTPGLFVFTADSLLSEAELDLLQAGGAIGRIPFAAFTMTVLRGIIGVDNKNLDLERGTVTARAPNGSSILVQNAFSETSQTTIPEPASVGLVGLGLAALVWRRRIMS